MEDDEEKEPFTAYDYWEEVYEDAMEHLKYMMRTHREDASIDFKEKLENITEMKQESPKFHRFFYNSRRSLDELAYLMMNECDREDIYH